MEFRHIRYFLAVARHLNFTRAAEELHIVQPALSQQIKKLEQELDVPLFFREAGRVALTPAGEAFLPRARRILSEVDDAARELGRFRHAQDEGQVAFGLMHTLGQGPVDVPALMAGFSRRFPRVRVAVREGTPEELAALLQQGQLDAAVLDVALLPPLAPLRTQALGVEPLVVLVGASHRLASQASASLADLQGEPFLQLASGSASRLDAIVQACRAAGHEPRFSLSPSSVPMARSLVSSGAGVYITYRWAAQAPGPPVKALELAGSPLASELALVWRGGIEAPAAAFLRFAWPALRFLGQGAVAWEAAGSAPRTAGTAGNPGAA